MSVSEAPLSFLALYMFEGMLQTVSVLQTRPVNRLGCRQEAIESFEDEVSALHIPSITLRSRVLMACRHDR